MDQASLGLIYREVIALYHDGTDSLDPQDMHFSDFSDWLLYTSDHRAELQKKQREFWSETLKDVQPTYLLSSTPSEEPLSDLTELEATLDASTLALCHSLMKEIGATPSEGFFAVYNTLLYHYSSQETMVVGTTFTQRNTSQLANVVGPLTAFLPIKSTVDPNQTFQEYFTDFRADLSKSLENGDIIYEDINSEFSDPSRLPSSFRHSFTYDEMNVDAISKHEMKGMEVKNFRTLSKTMDKDQELLLDIYGKTGRIILRFNNHIFSEEKAREFLDTYVTFVEALCRSPDSRMCNLSAINNPETLPVTEAVPVTETLPETETVPVAETAPMTATTPVTSLETSSLLAVTTIA
jgi:non-ribosomal peptide synthetase component F